MTRDNHNATEWLLPLAFILCAGWVIWNGASYVMAFGGYSEPLAARYRQINVIDYAALLGLAVFLVLGVRTVKRADMEYERWGGVDRLSVFVGRVTMMLIALILLVMVYEVVLRYAFEKPTLWANEMSLWMAGFVFVMSGLYAMQQRSHIRIFLLYDMMPRPVQKLCDTVSTLLIVVFTFGLIYGGYGEAKAKLLRWETFGTAFDPPIPATLKPLVLLMVVMVAVQAVSNLIRDWNVDPGTHSAADDIDEEEIERLRKAVGADGIGGQDVTRSAVQHTRTN